MHGEGEEDPHVEMRRGGTDPPRGRCAEMRRADAPRSAVHGAEMLMPEVILVEEAAIGEHRDITSESS
jgi:hypothetical protein